MISKEELLFLKEERKVMVASRDEAKYDYIEASKAFDSADRKNYRERLAEVRYKREIYYWFDYQVKELTRKINNNYRDLWNNPKPRSKVEKRRKKK